MSGAQAADLPVKAKPVEYVRICSLYGAGFYYIPGTDTCIRLGGYLRAEIVINNNNDYGPNGTGVGGANNRFTNAYTWRGRNDLFIDTRTATEYGVVRSYGEMTMSWTTDTYVGLGDGRSLYGNTLGVGNNAISGAVAGGTLGVYYAYIQFAGFTIGKAISEFSSNWQNYPGNNYDGLVGGGGAVTGVNQFTYTAQFGNGVSAAVSVQDQVAYFQANVVNLGTLGPLGTPLGLAGGLGSSNYAGTIAPDVIGTFTVDQAWGYFKFSAAGHDNHAAYYGGTEDTGHPSDVWGWAVQAALTIKNIPTGPGDNINIQGVYTDGATRYNIQDLAGGWGATAIYSGPTVPGHYQGITLGFAPDTVYANGGDQQKIQTWGMRGAFNHNFDPFWSAALYGAYAQINYNDTSKTLICGVGGVSGGAARAIFNPVGPGIPTTHIDFCDPNYNIGQLGFIVRWTPVKNLTFSADFVATHVHQESTGTVSAAAVAFAKPNAIYDLKDGNTYTALLRAQRNF
jgi:hypothetical protein